MRFGLTLAFLALAGGCDDGGGGGADPSPRDMSQTDATSGDAMQPIPDGQIVDGGPRDGTIDDASPRDGAPPDASPDASPDAGAPDAALPAAPLPPPPAPADASGDRISTSSACVDCHSNAAGTDAMRTAAGEGVAPYDLWQATMMANAARDPLWRAAVSVEVAATPAAAGAIEDKCTRCHAPGAQVEAGLRGEAMTIAALMADTPTGHLGRDGVTCTVCHQIEATGLGTAASFTGGFAINAAQAIYGPHAAPFDRPMVMNSGYRPVEAAHMSQAALCGSCHTLITDSLDAAGAATGHSLIEQGTFLEWRASRFGDQGVTCQSCHMPARAPDGTPIRTRIARRPGGGTFPPTEARSPYNQHVFVGANTLVPAILRDQAEHLRPQAPAEAFDAVIATAEDSLRAAARIEIRALDAGRAAIDLFNEVGHKFPSGFPSRRAWLWIEVTDAAGAVLLRSGHFDARGRLVDAGDRPLPSERAEGPLLTPAFAIEGPEQVALFESVMCDPDGAPTWILLRGARFCHDTRLLPAGWRADRPDAAATAPIGTPEDFVGGQATVTVTLPPGAAQVEARLYYQTLGARHGAELLRFDTPEVAALRYYLDRAETAPVEVGRAIQALP